MFKPFEIRTEGEMAYVQMRWNNAIDFANYFIKNGIATTYSCAAVDGDIRLIAFNMNNKNANIMVAWIKSYKDGHSMCPFCGGVGEVHDHDGLMHIRCTKCGCRTDNVSGFHDESYAWKLWDERKE
jgi:hypothetical protein